MPPPRPAVASLDLPLAPPALLAAWRPADRLLILPVRHRVPVVARRVEARITVVGLGAAATITGRVVRAQQSGAACFVEVAPDAARVKALENLVAVAASGAPAPYPPREARLLAGLPTVILSPSGSTYMSTVDVSANGCALAWTGAAPTLGSRVALRLGMGKDVAGVVGEIRWTRSAGGSCLVGMKLTGGDRDAWSRMHGGLRRSGAPVA